MKIKKNYGGLNFIFLFILVVFLFVSGCQYVKNPIQSDDVEDVDLQSNDVSNINQASDSGEIDATVKDIEGNYAIVEVTAINFYSRDPSSTFKQVEQGDTLRLYLPWGSEAFDTKLQDAVYNSTVPGMRKGEKIRGNIAGCPVLCNSGSGWSLFLYTKV